MMGVSLDTSTTYLEVLGSFLATSPSSFEQQQQKLSINLNYSYGCIDFEHTMDVVKKLNCDGSWLC